MRKGYRRFSFESNAVLVDVIEASISTIIDFAKCEEVAECSIIIKYDDRIKACNVSKTINEEYMKWWTRPDELFNMQQFLGSNKCCVMTTFPRGEFPYYENCVQFGVLLVNNISHSTFSNIAVAHNDSPLLSCNVFKMHKYKDVADFHKLNLKSATDLLNDSIVEIRKYLHNLNCSSLADFANLNVVMRRAVAGESQHSECETIIKNAVLEFKMKASSENCIVEKQCYIYNHLDFKALLRVPASVEVKQAILNYNYLEVRNNLHNYTMKNDEKVFILLDSSMRQFAELYNFIKLEDVPHTHELEFGVLLTIAEICKRAKFS